MRLVVLVSLALVLAGCAGAPAQAPPSTADPAVTAAGPAWTFTATDGTSYTNESDANATVLFFMATWCSSCRNKAPVLAKVDADYAGRGVRMLSVDFDPTESAADLARWQDELHQSWPHGVDTGLKLQRHFQVTSQSTVLVLDAEGNVVERFGWGGLTEASYRAALDRALSA